MRRKLLQAITIICVFIALNFLSYAKDINIIQNPGFEEVHGQELDYWTTTQWNQGTNATSFKVDSSEKKSGSNSACIVNNQANDARIVQILKVEQNSTYKISCYIKTKDVPADAKGANISVESLTQTSRDITGNTEYWEYVTLYGKTGANQNQLALTLGLGGYGSTNTGTAWFDDVEVIKVDTVPNGGTIINLDPNGTGSTNKTSSNKMIFVGIIAAVLLGIGIVLFFIFRASKNGVQRDLRQTSDRSKFEKADFIIIGIMTLIYAAIALFNLGTMNFPTTSWTPKLAGESFTIDLGKDVTLSRLYYNCGLGDIHKISGKYRVQYLDSNNNFNHLAAIDKKDIFIWKSIDLPTVKTSKLKFIVDVPGATLNEIGIFSSASDKSIQGIKIIDKNVNNNDEGKIENLFDEQQTIPTKISYLNGMYFDEIYHARTAYEYLHNIDPYENTHPPLGKIFISIGIAVFGMVPFGWRIVGTIFGIGMVPLMYMFGKKLFKDRFFAFCSAFLMMFDFMHFTQTRIATIDVYVTFFVILTYYFMYDFYTKHSFDIDYRSYILPLLFCGLSFGLGFASKWIAMYGAPGILLLFILKKREEYREFLRYKKSKKARGETLLNKFASIYMYKTMTYCIVFFIVIPAIIYTLSYIPFLMAKGMDYGWDIVIKNSESMYNYHSTLNATHPYQSAWWEWPIIKRPICYYLQYNNQAGTVSNITAMGNPVVWWGGLVSAIVCVFMAIKRKNRKDLIMLFIAIIFQFIPWVIIPRIAFIYHYFSIVPFIILLTVYLMKTILDKSPEYKGVIYFYLGIVLVLFVMFYPVISGMEVSTAYTRLLKWGTYWPF